MSKQGKPGNKSGLPRDLPREEPPPELGNLLNAAAREQDRLNPDKVWIRALEEQVERSSRLLDEASRLMQEMMKNFRDLNNERAVAQNLLKKIRQKNRALLEREKVRVDPDGLRDIAERTRMKNGKLNYSAIGRELGIVYHTAKKWCRDSKIR